MSIQHHPNFLRTVLRIDAATCVATGLLMTLGASSLAGLTQLPSQLLFAAGLSLLPIAAFIVFVAARAPVWPLGVWLIILGNIGWVLASVWLLIAGTVTPNALGAAFVIVQAMAVAVLATLEFMGVRDAPAPV
jgi:hypothetical protein